MATINEKTQSTHEDVVEKPSSLEGAAAAGNAQETSLTLSQAFRIYKKAVAWSIGVSMATIMESYDIQIVNSFYAFPQFTKKYGVPVRKGYQIEAKWQTALSLAALIGLIVGVFLNGWLAERYGPRRVMMSSFVVLTGTIFITFFAPSVEVLFVGELLCAIPWGLFAAATPSYAAEICPMVLRGYLTTYVNLCWVMGRFIATGVLTSLIKNPTQWSYRIPFALQWMWPVPLFIVVWLCPESPWWLVRKGRLEDAEKSLNRLVTDPEGLINTKDTVAMMVHTTNTEREMNVGGSYIDCFKGTNRRRTEIAMISWGCQLLPGFAIQNYITYFFVLAGLSTTNSFKLSLGIFSMAFTGTCLSWLLQKRFGRRPIYLMGLATMLPVMLLVGFIELAPGAGTSSKIKWTQCSFLLLWFFSYGLTIGPIPYAIAAEVGASNLRMKTIALGRNMYYFLSIINSVVSPYMLNPAQADLKGKAAFPAAGFTIILLVWTFFRLPETKGMTQDTLDHLFHGKVPARKFEEEAKKIQ